MNDIERLRKILKIGHVSSWKIILKYFTPLLAPIFFISFTFGVSGAILAESGLSFLGIGITPPQMSWGVIISEGKEVIDTEIQKMYLHKRLPKKEKGQANPIWYLDEQYEK